MVAPPDRSNARDGVRHGVRHGLADAEVACKMEKQTKKSAAEKRESAHPISTYQHRSTEARLLAYWLVVACSLRTKLDLRCAILSRLHEEHILALEVPVNDFAVMNVFDSHANLHEPFEHERLGEQTTVLQLDATVQIAAVGVPADEKQKTVQQ